MWNAKQHIGQDGVSWITCRQQNKETTHLKLVIWYSNKTRKRSLTSWNFSFSSCVMLPTPSGLQRRMSGVRALGLKLGFGLLGLDRRQYTYKFISGMICADSETNEQQHPSKLGRSEGHCCSLVSMSRPDRTGPDKDGWSGWGGLLTGNVALLLTDCHAHD